MGEEFSSKHIIRGTAVTSALTMVSRFLGFIRDLIVAVVFGASSYADAYFVAFRIPNLLRSMVAEGALSAAFVPIFSREIKKGAESAQAAFKATFSFLILITSVLTIAGIIFAPQIIDTIAPGFAHEHKDLCVALTRIMFPYIIFVSLVAMINGALTSLKSFGAAAAAQSVMNLVLILGGVVSALFSSENGTLVLSCSVILGGLLQVTYQIPCLNKFGLKLHLSFNNSAKIISELVKLMLPAIFGATVYQLMIFLSTMLASLLEPGAVSWLFYADRLVQLPIGIFSVALGTVLLPALSANAADNDGHAFSKNLVNSLRYSGFILIPLSFYIYFAADELVKILFERGAFDAVDSYKTKLAVQALSIGIWASSCQALIARAFMAHRDNVTPTLIGVASLITNFCIALLLMGEITVSADGLITTYIINIQNTLLGLWSSAPDFAHAGLSLASSLASLAALLLSVLLLKCKVRINLRPAGRSTLLALTSSLAAYLVSSYIEGYLGRNILSFIVLSFAFVSIFVVMQIVLHSQEFVEIRERLVR